MLWREDRSQKISASIDSEGRGSIPASSEQTLLSRLLGMRDEHGEILEGSEGRQRSAKEFIRLRMTGQV